MTSDGGKGWDMILREVYYKLDIFPFLVTYIR